MTKVITTVVVGKYFNEVAKLSVPLMERYAKRIGADFIKLTNQKDYRHPSYVKLELGEILNNYDRAMHIDCDAIVRPDTPNVFDIVPEGCLGMFEEWKHANRQPNLNKVAEILKLTPGRRYYNAGIIVCSKQHKHIFQKRANRINDFYEQTFLSTMINHYGLCVHELGYKFNHMTVMGKDLWKNRIKSYIVHYAGLSRMVQEEFVEMMKSDILTWRIKLL